MKRLLILTDTLSWEWMTDAPDPQAAQAEALERVPQLRGRTFRLRLLPLYGEPEPAPAVVPPPLPMVTLGAYTPPRRRPSWWQRLLARLLRKILANCG